MPVHHASHRSLVVAPDAVPDQRWSGFDAVVVPTVNTAERLDEAARIAEHAGCALFVLASGATTSGCQARAALDAFLSDVQGRGTFDVTLLELPDGYAHPIFEFQTTGHTEALEGRNNDVSLKRNIGLAVARMRGWRSVLFLDDDVRQSGHQLAHETWNVLDSDPRLEAAGWACTGHDEPADRCSSDNSMVCHAARLAGFPQDTFIGGGALGIRLTEGTPFFPNTYNEDWLFLFDLIERGAVALVGELTQLPYDPFVPARLGWLQEFGDVLAEGLFRLPHEGGGLDDAQRLPFWRHVVDLRKKFIREIQEALDSSSVPVGVLKKVRPALGAARCRISDDWPEALTEYVRHWRQDQAEWTERMGGLPEADSIGEALDWLSLDRCDRLAVGRARVLFR